MCEAVDNSSSAQHDGSLEPDLFSRAQNGEMSAFEELVARYRDAVYGLTLRLTRSETRAAEIAEESFFSAHSRLKELRSEAQFAAWVHRIAANAVATGFVGVDAAQSAEEKLKLPQFNERGSLAQYPETDWSRRAEEPGLNGELRRAIEAATDRLPLAHREVLLLKDVIGLGYEEIAEICGDSVHAIKGRAHEARLSLREEIDRFYTGNQDGSGAIP
jgi:RNA polymerase sigma-70 factor (ECF subfamily)